MEMFSTINTFVCISKTVIYHWYFLNEAIFTQSYGVTLLNAIHYKPTVKVLKQKSHKTVKIKRVRISAVNPVITQNTVL